MQWTLSSFTTYIVKLLRKWLSLYMKSTFCKVCTFAIVTTMWMLGGVETQALVSVIKVHPIVLWDKLYLWNKCLCMNITKFSLVNRSTFPVHA